jgi:hypothetical protein
MPRHPRRISHRGSRPLRAAGGAVEHDPAARLRALIGEGIIAAAALSARDDLEVAAASTQRLGSLTSGMWRALSKELVTAAERLDRSTADRLDDISRRARSLDVDEADVIAAGVAAGHLDSHRETLESLVPAGDAARLLLGKDMLFGFSIDEPLLNEDEDEDEDEGNLAAADAGADTDDDEPLPWSVRVRLFLWPAPLKSASVSFNPLPIEEATEPYPAQPANLNVEASELLIEALGKATSLSVDSVERALSDLGVACFTAHLMDELADDDPTDDDADDVSDEEDQSLGVDLDQA